MSVTPSSTVVGIFRERAMAEQAIEALYDAGFHREQIRYSMPGNAGSFFEDLKNLFTGTNPPDTGGDHLANDLTGMGLSDEEAQYYTNEYKNGNTILTVQAADREQEALSVLHQYGAYNARVSPGSFSTATKEATDNEQQPTEQETDIEEREAQPPLRTTEEHPVRDEEHEQADQMTPSGQEGDHPEAYASQATDMSSRHNADHQEARSDEVAQEHIGDRPAYQSNGVAPEYKTSQTSQASGVTTGHEDELPQLQEQIRSLQQQLEEAKAQLQTAKEHEAHLQMAREREQQLQSARQQMQDLQAELQATHTELRETQARIGQYR